MFGKEWLHCWETRMYDRSVFIAFIALYCSKKKPQNEKMLYKRLNRDFIIPYLHIKSYMRDCKMHYTVSVGDLLVGFYC